MYKQNALFMTYEVLIISDKMKDVMVAKVVHQCSELYADAMKLMQLSTLKELWPKVTIVKNKGGNYKNKKKLFD